MLTRKSITLDKNAFVWNEEILKVIKTAVQNRSKYQWKSQIYCDTWMPDGVSFIPKRFYDNFHCSAMCYEIRTHKNQFEGIHYIRFFGDKSMNKGFSIFDHV